MNRLVKAGLVALAGYGLYRLAKAYAPDDVGARAREFADDVRAGMAQREGELKAALGMEAGIDLEGESGDDGGAGAREGESRHTGSDSSGLSAERSGAPARLDPETARALLDDPMGFQGPRAH